MRAFPTLSRRVITLIALLASTIASAREAAAAPEPVVPSLRGTLLPLDGRRADAELPSQPFVALVALVQVAFCTPSLSTAWPALPAHVAMPTAWLPSQAASVYRRGCAGGPRAP